MVCFVAFTNGKVLAWSKKDQEGWPPNGFGVCFIFYYIRALVCCKSSLLQLLRWPELPCPLVLFSQLYVLSWYLTSHPKDRELFGEKPSVHPASAPSGV